MNKLRLNKILLGFILSHLFVLIVPFLFVSAFIIPRFTGIVEQGAKKDAQSSISNAVNVLDMRLKELNELSVIAGQNKYVTEMLADTYRQSSDSIMRQLYLLKDLNAMTASNGFLQDSFFYFENSDSIVAKSAAYSGDLFYSSILSYKGMDKVQWIKKIQDTDFKIRVWPSMEIKKDNTTQRVITYVTKIPFGVVKSSGYLVVLINEDNIRTLFENNQYSKTAMYSIMDEQQNLIVSSGNEDYMRKAVREEKENEFFNTRIGREEFLGFWIKSPTSGWTYTYFLPIDDVMNSVNNLKTVIYIVLFICIAAGVLMSYFLSHNEYKPIKGIFDTIGETGYSKRLEGLRDYDFIKKTIRTAFDENKELETRFKNNIPNIRLNFIDRLLKGRIKSNRELEQVMEVLDIQWLSKGFEVACFKIDDLRGFDKGAATDEKMSEGNLALARFALSNVIEEIASTYGLALIMEEDEGISLLLNFQEGMTEEQCTHAIESIAAQTIEFFYEKMGITISVGIGNLCQDAGLIGKVYREAVQALDYRMLSGKKSIICYSDIHVDSTIYEYPIELELQIIGLAKNGEFEQVRNIMKHIFEENFKKRKLSIKMVRCVAMDIMCTILKVLNEINIHYTEILGENDEFQQTLLDCGTVEEMYEEIIKILDRIGAYIQATKQDDGKKLKMDILAFINDNYFESGLTLTAVSDSFRLSTSYVSGLVKEATECGFTDYLVKLRVEKAIELMKYTNLSVNEISVRVGYPVVHSFIRNFKKYTALTPGQYKEMLEEKKLE